MPYNSTYYYTAEFTELPTYFWYVTAAGGPIKGECPVEQGEGCTMDWENKDLCTAKGSRSKLGPRVGDPLLPASSTRSSTRLSLPTQSSTCLLSARAISSVSATTWSAIPTLPRLPLACLLWTPLSTLSFASDLSWILVRA